MSAPGGDILLADMTQISNAARGIGALGGIEIETNNLTLLNSAVSGDNLTTQPGGNITVTLSGTLNVGGTDFNSFIDTLTRGPAPAANLNVVAKGIVITDGARLSTETFSSGPGGQLNISTNNLQLTNGGQLRSGSVIDPFALPGETPEIPSGPGGTINIQGLTGPAASVLIDGTGSRIFTNAVGTGAAGNTNISAHSVTIQNGGAISAETSGTTPSATGGSIRVDATDQVTMTGGASITASSTGPGKAGNIRINAGQTFVATNSENAVTTRADAASGGDITLVAIDRVQLNNSQISTSVVDGSGGGGDISIDPQYVILQNSQILAQAKDGQGGAITITTNLFLPDATSLVNADSGRPGLNGTVTIQSPNSPISGQIQPLDKSPLIATSLLNQRCASLAGGEFSSFTVAGRDSLPTEPDSWLASPLATLNAGMGLGVKAEGGRAEGMTLESSPTGEPPLLSLRQIAPAGFLIQAFAVDWSASCQS